MDKDLNLGPDPTRTNRRRVVQKSQEPEGPDAHFLPGAVGNRAFTQLATGGINRSALPTQGAGELDETIADAIEQRRGRGTPLDEETRADMESHIGTDLGDVNVHTDGSSHDLNRAVNAEAFTTGSDVFFKQGKYSPGTSDGRKLLAHELTHVAQQRQGDGPGGGRVSHPEDPQEVEARAVADSLGNAPSGGVDRQEELPEEELAMSVDRQDELEEEELAMSVDRQEELPEEELAMSVDRQDELEEEELAMSVDRQDELPEEELAMSVDRQDELEEEELAMSVDRQEELPEEELAMSVDRRRDFPIG